MILAASMKKDRKSLKKIKEKHYGISCIVFFNIPLIFIVINEEKLVTLKVYSSLNE